MERPRKPQHSSPLLASTRCPLVCRTSVHSFVLDCTNPDMPLYRLLRNSASCQTGEDFPVRDALRRNASAGWRWSPHQPQFQLGREMNPWPRTCQGPSTFSFEIQKLCIERCRSNKHPSRERRLVSQSTRRTPSEDVRLCFCTFLSHL